MEQSSKDTALRIFVQLFTMKRIIHQDIIKGVEIVLSCILCAKPSREEAIRLAEGHLIYRGQGAHAYKFGQACGWLAKILKNEGIEAFVDAVNSLYAAVGIKEKLTGHFIGALKLIDWFQAGVVTEEEVTAGIRNTLGTLDDFLMDTAGFEEDDPAWVAKLQQHAHEEIRGMARLLLDRQASKVIPRDSSNVFATALEELFEAGVEASRTSDIRYLVQLIRVTTHQPEEAPRTQTRSMEECMWRLPTDTEFGKVVIGRDPLHTDVLVITTANRKVYRVTVAAITRAELH